MPLCGQLGELVVFLMFQTGKTYHSASWRVHHSSAAVAAAADDDDDGFTDASVTACGTGNLAKRGELRLITSHFLQGGTGFEDLEASNAHGNLQQSSWDLLIVLE